MGPASNQPNATQKTHADIGENNEINIDIDKGTDFVVEHVMLKILTLVDNIDSLKLLVQGIQGNDCIATKFSTATNSIIDRISTNKMRQKAKSSPKSP